MKDKVKDTIYDIYRELYFYATPSIDFDKLRDESPVENGVSIIPYSDYEIDKEQYEEIINRNLCNKKLRPSERNQIRIAIALGCSPKFKQE